MEKVVKEIKQSYPNFWYKLYADDMVIILEHKEMKKFLIIMINTFKEFDLIFNPKKSAIVNIKNHSE